MFAFTDAVSGIWDRVQRSLFPALEDAGVDLTEKFCGLIAVFEVLQIERFVAGPSAYRVGAKPKDRRCLARALIAKAYYTTIRFIHAMHVSYRSPDGDASGWRPPVEMGDLQRGLATIALPAEAA